MGFVGDVRLRVDANERTGKLLVDWVSLWGAETTEADPTPDPDRAVPLLRKDVRAGACDAETLRLLRVDLEVGLLVLAGG